MLPEIGASELLVIAVVALIVVGPKDLPALLRKLGQFTAKIRNMAAEFRASFDEMARQSELDDLRKEVEAMRAGQAAAASAISAPLSSITSEIEQSLASDAMTPAYYPGEPADAFGVAAEPPPKPKKPRKPRAQKPPSDETVS